MIFATICCLLLLAIGCAIISLANAIEHQTEEIEMLNAEINHRLTDICMVMAGVSDAIWSVEQAKKRRKVTESDQLHREGLRPSQM